jgi:uncharacterized membrane protein YjfL (UPF0719 family)
MWDFSDDESIFFWVALIGAVICAARWYWRLFRVSPWVLPRSHRTSLAIAPIAGILCVGITLVNWSDPQVRGHVDYELLFLLGAAMWMGISAGCFGWIGLNVREDAIQRANLASNIGTCGAIVGVGLAYAGSNIGAGPTIWTTLVPAFGATVSLLVVWFVVSLVSGAHEAIAVDRDVASGIRLAGLLIALGLIFGGAMAGDFSNWAATFGDFIARAWPALRLAVVAIVIQRIARPTPQRPIPPPVLLGVLPAVAFILAAVIIAWGIS